MSLIGGTTISDDYYWSSTQNSSTKSWILYWGSDYLADIYKSDKHYVRAFCLLSNNQNT